MRHGAESFKVAHCGFESLPDYDCKCDGSTQKTQIRCPNSK